MTSKERSVAMFIDALKNHSASKLRQLPLIDRSQNLAMGTQLTKPLTMAQDEYDATTPIMTKQAMRNALLGKMRRYWNRIEYLVHARLALYMGMATHSICVQE